MKIRQRKQFKSQQLRWEIGDKLGEQLRNVNKVSYED